MGLSVSVLEASGSPCTFTFLTLFQPLEHPTTLEQHGPFGPPKHSRPAAKRSPRRCGAALRLGAFRVLSRLVAAKGLVAAQFELGVVGDVVDLHEAMGSIGSDGVEIGAVMMKRVTYRVVL